jgi:hypothetical protein
VVVEAVMHHIEHGMEPKAATLKAMEEVSGPVIAIALILVAVFVPTAFVPGITGRMYQQFAVTIAVAIVIRPVKIPSSRWCFQLWPLKVSSTNWASAPHSPSVTTMSLGRSSHCPRS